jgi:hypothetical protein
MCAGRKVRVYRSGEGAVSWRSMYRLTRLLHLRHYLFQLITQTRVKFVRDTKNVPYRRTVRIFTRNRGY